MARAEPSEQHRASHTFPGWKGQLSHDQACGPKWVSLWAWASVYNQWHTLLPAAGCSGQKYPHTLLLSSTGLTGRRSPTVPAKTAWAGTLIPPPSSDLKLKHTLSRQLRGKAEKQNHHLTTSETTALLPLKEKSLHAPRNGAQRSVNKHTCSSWYGPWHAAVPSGANFFFVISKSSLCCQLSFSSLFSLFSVTNFVAQSKYHLVLALEYHWTACVPCYEITSPTSRLLK